MYAAKANVMPGITRIGLSHGIFIHAALDSIKGTQTTIQITSNIIKINIPQTKTQPPFKRNPTVPFKTNSKGQRTAAIAEQQFFITNIENKVNISEGANFNAYLSLAFIS